MEFTGGSGVAALAGSGPVALVDGGPANKGCMTWQRRQCPHDRKRELDPPRRHRCWACYAGPPAVGAVSRPLRPLHHCPLVLRPCEGRPPLMLRPCRGCCVGTLARTTTRERWKERVAPEACKSERKRKQGGMREKRVAAICFKARMRMRESNRWLIFFHGRHAE
jgi:hypothetical protein